MVPLCFAFFLCDAGTESHSETVQCLFPRGGGVRPHDQTRDPPPSDRLFLKPACRLTSEVLNDANDSHKGVKI